MTDDAPDIFAPDMSVSEITERVYLGSRPLTMEHYEHLKKDLGVTHILNVCEKVDPLAMGAFYYLFNPAPDDKQPKPVEWFQKSIRFALGECLMASGKKLYVHCESGMNRSAATVYAILTAFGIDKVQAALMIKTHRPEALWWYIDSANRGVEAGW